MLSKDVIKELKKILGKGSVSTDREDCLCYSYDATNQRFLPDAVVFPASADEVAKILRLANIHEFPVTPRGAGSGFTGGSLPVNGGVVLSAEKLNRILEVDAENMLCVVEPGVVTCEVQECVEKHGLFYPPDPSSLKFSTIGGNIAECAGGPRALKYGVTKDYVLGLEVVLPTGDIINTGVRTVKGVVGYDLTRLIVGSEGTLGVVTKAALRLIPLPHDRKTMLALFSDMNDAARTVSSIIASRIIPSTLEFIDGECIRCVDDYLEMGFPEKLGAMLLIEVDGGRETVERDASSIKDICLKNGSVEVKTASKRKEVRALWNARRAISPSLARYKLHKINEDVVVPRNRIPELIAGVREIAGSRGLKVANFGHAGDGNIHVNILADRDKPGEMEKAEEAVKEIFRLTIGLGGSMSGEHGVGITKAPYLGMELDAAQIALMKRIKKAFDPRGILNPGKIFPVEED